MPGGGKIGFLSALYRSSGGEQEAPEGSSAAGVQCLRGVQEVLGTRTRENERR